jgi:hypothetical protein
VGSALREPRFDRETVAKTFLRKEGQARLEALRDERSRQPYPP